MSRLQQGIAKATTRKSGEAFFLRRVLTSSGITTAAQNLTTAATGRLYLEDIVFETDGTGLATGTNFVISKTGTYGNLTVTSDAISGLGANVTHACKAGTNGTVPSVSNNVPCVLEAGDKLTYANTVAGGTGGGTITVTMYFRRVDSNTADITAAGT